MRPGSHRLSSFIALGTLWLGFTITTAQSPPRLLPEAFEQQERVVPEGTTVHLSCPVEADPDTLFFEWFRDREALDLFADDRYRVQGNGALRIKTSIPEDTGFYTCRAVNGFGRTDVNVTLIVLGSPDNILPTEEENFGNVDESDDDDTQPAHKDVPIAENGKPVLTSVSPHLFRGSVLQRLVGTSISLRCGARGNPRPQVSWLKNGKPLPDSNLPSNTRRGHWTLHLRNLQASDTGNYTCHVYNGLGSASATFGIKVIDRVRTKPEFVSNEPHNETVKAGDSAILQCLLISDIPPHVQWLKQIPDKKAESDGFSGVTTVKLLGEYFQVLKSTEIVETAQGSFLNKLVIPEVREKDSGKYICLGANAMGFSFRSAFLVVLPRLMSPELGVGLVLPFPIVIGIAVSGIILLAGLLGLGLYCRSSRHFLPVPSSRVTTATTNTTGSSSSSCGTSTAANLKDNSHPLADHRNHLTKHPYVGMSYHPHLDPLAREDTLPARIYIPNGQLHRTVPLNSIFL